MARSVPRTKRPSPATRAVEWLERTTRIPPEKHGRTCRSAAEDECSRERLRRRPTAGNRSSQAQPFGRHLLVIFREPQPTMIRPTGLPALELGLALLLEGGYPFLGVLGHEHAPDRFPLDREAHVQWGPVALRDGELGMSDGNPWSGRELRRVFERACTAGCGVPKQLVDDADVLGLGGPHRGRVGDEVHSLGKADEPR